jgi:hypothetical protein
MHLWAALSGTSCGFTCFKGYIMFFTNIGLFLIILSHQYWSNKLPIWRNIISGLFVLFLLLELAHWNTAWQRLILRGVRWVLNIEIPWRTSHGSIVFWGLIENFFGGDLPSIEHAFYTFVYWAIPLVFVLIFTPLLIKGVNKFNYSFRNYSCVLFTSTLFFVGVLTPLKSIGGELNAKQCQSDVIVSHEIAGEFLKSRIPTGSKVYWAIESWMMFLYIPEVEIFPPQTLIHYSYFPSTPDLDEEFLLKYGRWNSELKEQWIDEADFILVEGRYYRSEWRSRVEAGELSLFDITPPVEDCRGDNASIIILKNIIEAND